VRSLELPLLPGGPSTPSLPPHREAGKYAPLPGSQRGIESTRDPVRTSAVAGPRRMTPTLFFPPEGPDDSDRPFPPFTAGVGQIPVSSTLIASDRRTPPVTHTSVGAVPAAPTPLTTNHNHLLSTKSTFDSPLIN
jgi:hypothetical protein